MTVRFVGNQTGDEFKAILVDLLSPDAIFNPDVAAHPNIWAELRNLLVHRNVKVSVHERRRSAYTIANSLYDDAEEKAFALELAHIALNPARNHSANAAGPAAPHENHSSQQHFEGRTAHNIYMRLKESKSKLSGELGECWRDFVDEYDQVVSDYKITDKQQLRFMHNLLRKDTHRFFLDQVKPHAQTYREAVDLIDTEYNSIVRQTRVKNHLSTLRVKDYETEDTETAAALAKVYNCILTLSLQVPESHRGDAHCI